MDTYRIEDYGKKAPFSSFLPGIAGLTGIPLWCYYVNRGQAVVSFGSEDKDHPIMEFLPAHRAYTRAGETGFRTFLRTGEKVTEAFGKLDKADMEIGMNTLSVSTICQGIEIRITYFILPEEKLGALVRLVTLINRTGEEVRIEVLDGMPEVVPFGVTDWTLKNMLQTGKAWMQAEDVEKRTPFYRVRASMDDTADVREIEGGNFAAGISEDGEKLPVITDPEAIFGYDLSHEYPLVFEEKGLNGVRSERQHFSNLFPCAFFMASPVLAAGESYQMYELFGHAGSKEHLEEFLRKPLNEAYFLQKQEEAVRLTQELTDVIDTRTADPVFDLYCRYTYMDNVLRGGRPVRAGNKNLYVYSRKHGDLERDYNYFSMLPEYYSQGNANFRDVNQNRRSDTFFSPEVGKQNIRTFFELIQVDGYNPLSVDKQTFTYQGRTFTPGELYKELSEELPEKEVKARFEEILTQSKEQIRAHFGEGYWCDHWTYNLDLLEEYIEVWPDQAEELFVTPEYGYYQAETTILPRKKRYVKTDKGIRQYHSLLEADDLPAPGGRLKDASGKEVRSSILEKMILIAVMKFSAMDPYLMGVEMEGGKPGWYDALNGFPGILGSSMAETYELERWLKITLLALDLAGGQVSLLKELSDLVRNLYRIIMEEEPKDLAKREHAAAGFWNRMNDAKERFREQTFRSVSGERVSYGEDIQKDEPSIFLITTLRSMLYIVDTAIMAAEKQEAAPTYYYYEVTDYTEDEEGILPTGFIQHTMPPFLEGAVHLMKLDPFLVDRRKLYREVRESDLYDRKLKMYRVNASLDQASFEIGRCRAFTPGWLENGSIWLHMEYKYLLELLRGGLFKEFFEDWKNAAIPFLDPEVYGRSTLENSSFLASSLNPNEDIHGRGFVARLSGSTAEFLSIWRRMFFGEQLFQMQDGKLTLTFMPAIPAYLIPEDGIVRAVLLGKTPVTYHMAKKADVIPGNSEVKRILLETAEGKMTEIQGGVLWDEDARAVREGKIRSISVEVEN
ncbi:MAG: hypothetical protein IJM83_01925 [Firmicutes bacterium]|nr:hypothetical protein [Bacillota bacterium]